jgi:hypothetical protein
VQEAIRREELGTNVELGTELSFAQSPSREIRTGPANGPCRGLA